MPTVEQSFADERGRELSPLLAGAQVKDGLAADLELPDTPAVRLTRVMSGQQVVVTPSIVE